MEDHLEDDFAIPLAVRSFKLLRRGPIKLNPLSTIPGYLPPGREGFSRHCPVKSTRDPPHPGTNKTMSVSMMNTNNQLSNIHVDHTFRYTQVSPTKPKRTFLKITETRQEQTNERALKNGQAFLSFITTLPSDAEKLRGFLLRY